MQVSGSAAVTVQCEFFGEIIQVSVEMLSFCWKNAKIDPTTNMLHMFSTSAYLILKLELMNLRKFKFGNIKLHNILILFSSLSGVCRQQ